MLDLSRTDWRERIRSGRSLIPDVPLDAEAAAKAIGIFNLLRLPDVPGQPPMSEAAGDWFREIVGAVFGTELPDGLPREVREFFVLVAKKQTKTTGGAALMLTALARNRRPHAEFMFVGPTQEVAKIAFAQAVGMIEADPDKFLPKRFLVRDHLKEIFDRKTRSILKIKTFDTSVMTGSKPVGVLLDELHEISRNNESARVIGQIRGGMIANPEAFLVFITTQSDQPPQGAFRDELEKARAIRDGKRSGSMMPILYEFPEDIAVASRPGEDPPWFNSDLWWMVTPNRGRSVHIPRLIEEFDTARETGIHELARWASQHLNIEMGLGLRTDRWAGVEFWRRRIDTSLTLDVVLALSEVVVIGVDGGGLDDLFGLAVLGREKGGGRWLLWSHAWCHKGVLERRKSIAARLSDFAKVGELTIVDDRLDDLEGIIDIVRRVKDEGLLAAVAVDPAGLGELVDALAAIEVTADNKLLVGVGQGFRLMNSIKTCERKLANGTLWHGGSGLMSWCVSNLRIEPTATAVRATKMNAGDAKIDPIMGLFDAADLMSLNPAAAGSSEVELWFA